MRIQRNSAREVARYGLRAIIIGEVANPGPGDGGVMGNPVINEHSNRICTNTANWRDLNNIDL